MASTGTEPTAKQLGLAARLCRELSEGIPAHALVDKMSLSSYIDQLMSRKATSGGGGSGGGSGSVGSASTESFAGSGGDGPPSFLDSTPPPARFPY